MSRRKQHLSDVVPKLRHVYAYFWPEIRRYRGLVAVSLLMMAVGVVFRLLEPWPLKIFLDYVLAGQSGGSATAAKGWFVERLLAQPSSTALLLIAMLTVAMVALRVRRLCQQRWLLPRR